MGAYTLKVNKEIGNERVAACIILDSVRQSDKPYMGI